MLSTGGRHIFRRLTGKIFFIFMWPRDSGNGGKTAGRVHIAKTNNRVKAIRIPGGRIDK